MKVSQITFRIQGRTAHEIIYRQVFRFGQGCVYRIHSSIDESEFGFMNIRLQACFSYNIQICFNGREWLRRGLEKEGVGFPMRKGVM
ncbi:MAG: hypothetical protein D3924_17345 [Candidatus Electrothrix sp. AR4]|nr:hypothetical protein [Candidatus Electrothrix sp. AR4]